MALSARRSTTTTLLRHLTANTTTPFLRHLSTDSTSTITVEVGVPFIGHKIDPPSRSVKTTPPELLSFFRNMALMRQMEVGAETLYNAKLIRGFCHLYEGQEAVAAGMEAAITKKDSIITSYRDHCIFLERGGTLLEAFAEMMGRKDGCSKGRGGSMHMYKKEVGFYGGHAIVGAQIPLGCGLAFSQKYKNDDNVTFALYGDGAANQGQLFEALNMAALWDLPAIFVCENNHCKKWKMEKNVFRTRGLFIYCISVNVSYIMKLMGGVVIHRAVGMGTATWRATKSPAHYKRGDCVPGLKVH